MTGEAGVESAQFVHLSLQLQWKKPLTSKLSTSTSKTLLHLKGWLTVLEILLKTLLYPLNQVLCEISHVLLKDIFLHALWVHLFTHSQHKENLFFLAWPIGFVGIKVSMNTG